MGIVTFAIIVIIMHSVRFWLKKLFGSKNHGFAGAGNRWKAKAAAMGT